MYEDPIVDEVRKTRERLAEKYNFDVEAIFEALRKRQGVLGKRLVRRVRKQIPEQVAAPERNCPALHSGR
jgi:hypothetical protein